MHITRLRRAGIVATLLGVLLTLLPGVTASASAPTTTAAASGDPQIMVVCHRTYYGRVGQSYIARNDCLAPGAYLETGWYQHQGRSQQLTLTFQSDGNLVLYRWIEGQGFGTAIWATNTNGHNVGFASLQEDGNFVLYNAVGQPYWSTGTWNCPGSWDTKQLEMQLDENLVLYFWPTNGGPRSAKWDRWGIARCR